MRQPRRLPLVGRCLLLGLAGALLSACVPTARLAPSVAEGGPARAAPHATPRAADGVARRFEQRRDTFSFANLVRAERPGLNDAFANYCLIMTRGVGQFFRAARFDPDAPAVSAAEYTRLTREVLATTPWGEPRPETARIVVPGYPDLRTFSRTQEPAIKAAFGSNVLSMFDWRLWRVGVAFSPAHQARLAEDLVTEIDAGRPTPVMITNFPSDDLLNHAVLVYGHRFPSPSAAALELLAYDPNDPESPLSLYFHQATRAFWVPPLTYSPPGPIRAFRLYTSLLF